MEISPSKLGAAIMTGVDAVDDKITKLRRVSMYLHVCATVVAFQLNICLVVLVVTIPYYACALERAPVPSSSTHQPHSRASAASCIMMFDSAVDWC